MNFERNKISTLVVSIAIPVDISDVFLCTIPQIENEKTFAIVNQQRSLIEDYCNSNKKTKPVWTKRKSRYWSDNFWLKEEKKRDPKRYDYGIVLYTS